jgi:DNA-binding NtrC family response regulator
MPEIGGADLFRRIRAMQPTAAVIFVTGADDETLARELLREGATDFVRKPIDLEYCALAVLLSVARAAAPGRDGASEEFVQAVYRLVRRVRGMDEVPSRLREELEQLSFAALRAALAHDPDRAQQDLAMFRRCLEAAHDASIPAAERAALAEALADTST